MIEWIRYRFLMRRLRGEIAQLVSEEQQAICSKKIKTAAVTACKACGSIV